MDKTGTFEPVLKGFLWPLTQSHSVIRRNFPTIFGGPYWPNDIMIEDGFLAVLRWPRQTLYSVHYCDKTAEAGWHDATRLE